MSKKRAFVRYSKQGKIVPGSLILTGGSHPNGPSTWKEVAYDLCCDGGGCIGPYTFTLFEVPEDFGNGTYIRLSFNCLNETSFGFDGTIGYVTAQLSNPVITSPTLSELVDLINTIFAGQGITAQLVEGVLQVTVSNTDYISAGCTGSYLGLEVVIQTPA